MASTRKRRPADVPEGKSTLSPWEENRRRA